MRPCWRWMPTAASFGNTRSAIPRRPSFQERSSRDGQAWHAWSASSTSTETGVTKCSSYGPIGPADSLRTTNSIVFLPTDGRVRWRYDPLQTEMRFGGVMFRAPCGIRWTTAPACALRERFPFGTKPGGGQTSKPCRAKRVACRQHQSLIKAATVRLKPDITYEHEVKKKRAGGLPPALIAGPNLESELNLNSEI